jgi:hypothetical protein
MCERPHQAMQAFDASLRFTAQLGDLGLHDFALHDAAATGVGVAIGTRDLAGHIAARTARASS